MDKLSQLLNEHGVPETEEGLRSLFDAAFAEERAEYDVLGKTARGVFDAWILGNLSRRNGMEQLEETLRRLGF